METLGWSSMDRNNNNNNRDNNLRRQNIIEDRTYADARIFYPSDHPNQPNHEFFIIFSLVRHFYNDIAHSRLPGPPLDTLRRITDHRSNHEFSLPFRYFTSGRSCGEAAVAGMISGIRSPFPLLHQALFWRHGGAYSSAEPLPGGLAQVAYRVSSVAERAIGAAQGRPVRLAMIVTLENRVVLLVGRPVTHRPLGRSDQSVQTLTPTGPNLIRAQETLIAGPSRLRPEETLIPGPSRLRPEETLRGYRSRRMRAGETLNAGPSRHRAGETLGGDRRSRIGAEETLEFNRGRLYALFRALEIPMAEEALEALRIPARRSAVEGLRRSRHGGGGGAGDLSCVICMEDVVVGSEITWMACSHGFHSNCIAKWLETNHTCPICRFRLPSN